MRHGRVWKSLIRKEFKKSEIPLIKIEWLWQRPLVFLPVYTPPSSVTMHSFSCFGWVGSPNLKILLPGFPCSHVTKFWPMDCEQRLCPTSGSSLPLPSSICCWDVLSCSATADVRWEEHLKKCATAAHLTPRREHRPILWAKLLCQPRLLCEGK